MRKGTILGIMGCVVLLVVPASVNAATQPPGIQGNVTVVSPIPLPVTGSLAVSGTANVNVVNQDSHPVPVTNGPANTPLQVQLVTDPPWVPVASSSGVSQSSPVVTVYRVPDTAQRFVIELVTYDIAGLTSGGLLVSKIGLGVTTGGSSIEHYLTVAPVITYGTGAFKEYSLAQQVTLYADPGSDVTCQVYSDSATANSWSGTVTLGGRLVQ
jgi:hypothetical protein